MQKELVLTEKQRELTADFPLVRGDKNAYVLSFRAPHTVCGNITVCAARADGQTVIDQAAFTGDTARYVIKNSMYAIEGNLTVQITVCTDTGTVLTANTLHFKVLAGIQDENTIEADDRYPILAQLLYDTSNAVTAANKAAETAEDKANAAQTAAAKAEKQAAAAEVQGLFAESAGRDAAQAAETGNSLNQTLTALNEQVQTAFSEFDTRRKFTVPAGTTAQNGSLLALKPADTAEMQMFSVDLTEQTEQITEYGTPDAETAYIQIRNAVFAAQGVTDPLDERCIYGFSFLPSIADASADYDVEVETVTAEGDDYRLAFPLSQCPLFANADGASISDLFEGIMFNGEFPVQAMRPAWLAPEEALDGAFLDAYVISPANRLACAYTDAEVAAALEEAKTYTDESLQQNLPIAVDLNDQSRWLTFLNKDGTQHSGNTYAVETALFSVYNLTDLEASLYQGALLMQCAVEGGVMLLLFQKPGSVKYKFVPHGGTPLLYPWIELKTAFCNAVDNLESTDTVAPLSANMGRSLQTQITALQSRLPVWEKVAGYTHTGNRVIQPTALDKESGFFTCADHGLTENEYLTAVPPKTADVLTCPIPKELFDMAIYNVNRLYLTPKKVAVIDENTFALKDDNDEIITYTSSVNTKTDAAQFCFETRDGGMFAGFTNLNLDLSAYDVRIIAQNFGCRVSVIPNSLSRFPFVTEYSHAGGIEHGLPVTAIDGINAHGKLDLSFDGVHLFADNKCTSFFAKQQTPVTFTPVLQAYAIPALLEDDRAAFAENPILKTLTLNTYWLSNYPRNGGYIEVWKRLKQ